MRAATAMGLVTAMVLSIAGCVSQKPLANAQAPLSAASSPFTASMPEAVAGTEAASVPGAASNADVASATSTASGGETVPGRLPSPAPDAGLVPSDGATQSVRQKKRVLLAAYESKLRHDRAVVRAYQREHLHTPSVGHGHDRSYFLRRMLQDGLMRLDASELLEWAQLQHRLADRGALAVCSGLRSPQDERGQAMSINMLSVDEVAQYLNLSYQAIHDAAIGKPYVKPSKWRAQSAQINLAAQVVALIAQHPEDAKRLAIFEAEGERKTPKDKCWMVALGMRAALRLSDPDRDIILRTLVQRDNH